jgi:hypothetical protein
MPGYNAGLESANDKLGKRISELESQLTEARAACLDASTMINTVMERRDGELTGTAWGDLDNVRLDLQRAAAAGGPDD